jgi:multidrug efflux pump subunit AcrB
MPRAPSRSEVATPLRPQLEHRNPNVSEGGREAVIANRIGRPTGIEGKFFAPMAFTVAFALFGSLLCALTLVPVLSSLVLRGKIKEHEGRIFLRARTAYVNAVSWLMARRRLAVITALALLAGSLCLVPLLGPSFCRSSTKAPSCCVR